MVSLVQRWLDIESLRLHLQRLRVLRALKGICSEQIWVHCSDHCSKGFSGVEQHAGHLRLTILGFCAVPLQDRTLQFRQPDHME